MRTEKKCHAQKKIACLCSCFCKFVHIQKKRSVTKAQKQQQRTNKTLLANVVLLFDVRNIYILFRDSDLTYLTCTK